MKIYMASPLGFSEAGRSFYKDTLIRKVKRLRHKPVDPWTLTGKAKIDAVNSGTAAEIGYAFAKGKPILGYRGDFRLSADNDGSIVNLQVEYFIRQSGGDIVTGVAELGPALAKIKAAGLKRPL